MRRAFSLPELLLALALVSILLGIALPSLTQAVDRVEVHAAAAHLIAAHQRARMMAVARGQVLTLAMDSAALTIAERSSSTVLWSEPGPGASGVLLPGPTRHFTFAPEGFTLGLSNASLHLARGSASRTVVFSRLGRARLLP
jgi:prepilin-type N-terminal cleavage/methylation domain-containing protein